MPVEFHTTGNKDKAKKEATKAPRANEYHKVGRCTICYTPRGGNKPMFEGFLTVGDGENYVVTLFPPKEGSKCVASGYAKDGGAAVKFWISLLRGKEDSLYCLVNINGADKDAPPLKISLYQDDECEWYMSGTVSAPGPEPEEPAF